MNNYSSNSDEMKYTSCKELIQIKNDKIKNYDDIKNKDIILEIKLFKTLHKINYNTNMENNNDYPINDKKRKILIKKYKSQNLNVHCSFNDININKELYDSIIYNSKKIKNWVYSKINILNIKKLSDNYYNKIKYNVLNNNYFKYLEKLSYLEIFKNIFYEYNNLNDIYFNSNFELGNLLLVYQNITNKNEFELVINNDNKNEKDNDWFYFNIRGILKGTKARFNIMNIKSSNIIFENKLIAIKINSIDKNNNEYTVKDWSYKKIISKFSKNKNLNFYILSFDFEFENNDIIYFARNIPFSNSNFNFFLEKNIFKLNKNNNNMYNN